MKRFATLIFLFIILTNVLWAQPGTILNNFPSPTNNPADLAWDGQYLYLLGLTSHLIYKIDPATGQLLGTTPVSVSGTMGLTYVDGYLWISCISDHSLKKLDSNGNILKSVPIPVQQPIGIEWDGQAFWVAESYPPDEKIYHIDSTGVVLSYFLFPGDSPFGLTWDGSTIWCANNQMSSLAMLYQFDPSGNILFSMPAPNNPGAVNGLAWDGQYLWEADQTHDRIIQFEGHSVSPYGTIAGYVKDALTGEGIAMVPVLSALTDTSGFFILDSITIGQYSITISAAGYLDITQNVQVSGGDTTWLDVQMTPIGEPFEIVLQEDDGDMWTIRTYRNNTWNYFEIPLGRAKGSGSAFLDTPIKEVQLVPRSDSVGYSWGARVCLDDISIGAQPIDNFDDGDISDWGYNIAYNGSQLDTCLTTSTPDGSPYAVKMLYGNKMGQYVAAYLYKHYSPGFTASADDTLRLWIRGSDIYYHPYDDPFSYYPLAPGNAWEYLVVYTDSLTGLSDSLYLSRKVIGDTLIGTGTTYYVLEEKIVADSGIIELSHTYERVDSATGDVWMYDLDDGEVHMHNLLVQPGDSVLSFGEWFTFATWYPDTVLNYPTHTQMFTGGFVVYFLSSGLGLIQFEELGGYATAQFLTYAVVNGVEYGQPVGMEHRSETIPQTLVLEQNYPNPFNPETVIRFALPTTANVRLEVYNLLGQKVKTLVQGRLAAGHHQVTWNGTDEHGRPVASGLYLYRLDTGSQQQIRKMILMR